MNKGKLIKYLTDEISDVNSDLRVTDQYDFESQGQLISYSNALADILDKVERGEFDG